MAPFFSKDNVLSSRYNPSSQAAYIALDFAVLGKLDTARELVSIVRREHPLLDSSAASRLLKLNLAWQSSSKWPEGSSDFENDEEREDFEQELDAELWPDTIDDEECTSDEAGLKRILDVVKSGGQSTAKDNGPKNAEDDDYDNKFGDLEDEEDSEAVKSAALVKALDISVKLAEEAAGKAPLDQLDQRSQDILNQIAQRLHYSNQTDALASCGRLWPYLARGVVADAAGTDSTKLNELGEEITNTIKEWFSRKPVDWQPSSKSIKDLLQSCSDQSAKFAIDVDDKSASLFHEPASKQDIEELEKRLEAKLPSDYKEFLGISNGFDEVVTGGLFEGFEAALCPADQVTWCTEGELAGIDDSVDGEGAGAKDETTANGSGKSEGKDSSRPAKKIKLADGADATTKDADQDSEDDEDEGTGLEWFIRQAQGFSIDLLPLPQSGLINLAEDLDEDTDWPQIEKAIVIGADESDDNDDDDSEDGLGGARICLLAPERVRAARDAYVKILDNSEDEQLKKVIRWGIAAFTGTEDAFRKLDDWVLFAWNGGRMHCWTSFRRYLEEVSETALKLEDMVENDDDDEKIAKKQTLAYATGKA